MKKIFLVSLKRPTRCEINMNETLLYNLTPLHEFKDKVVDKYE